MTKNSDEERRKPPKDDFWEQIAGAAGKPDRHARVPGKKDVFYGSKT